MDKEKMISMVLPCGIFEFPQKTCCGYCEKDVIIGHDAIVEELMYGMLHTKIPHVTCLHCLVAEVNAGKRRKGEG